MDRADLRRAEREHQQQVRLLRIAVAASTVALRRERDELQRLQALAYHGDSALQERLRQPIKAVQHRVREAEQERERLRQRAAELDAAAQRLHTLRHGTDNQPAAAPATP